MPRKTPTQYTLRALQYFGALAFLYVLLILLLPANHQAMHDYHLSPLQYRILYFAVGIPAMIVWFAAFFGYARLEEYARSLKGSPEESSFIRLASGCRWLAWSLPVPAIAGISLNAIANAAPGFHAAAIIINNYITLGLSLVALSMIGLASRDLITRAKINFSATSARSIMLVFVVGGVLYCYFIFKHFEPGNLGSSKNPYFLPVWLMLVTVIIPYLYAWFVGLLATYEITTYSRQVRGLLYKQALRLLVAGLVTIIAGSIALQYVSSVVPPSGHLALNYRLLLITVFRVITGVGFGLVAAGALRLKRIEEV